jgi:hypothetical protein
MNSTEALVLVRMVRALCSGQKLDEYSPDAWAIVLDDIRFADAKEALASLGRTHHFIDPADIRVEVKRIRAERCASKANPAGGSDAAETWTGCEARTADRRRQVLSEGTRGELKQRGPLILADRRTTTTQRPADDHKWRPPLQIGRQTPTAGPCPDCGGSTTGRGNGPWLGRVLARPGGLPVRRVLTSATCRRRPSGQARSAEAAMRAEIPGEGSAHEVAFHVLGRPLRDERASTRAIP